MITDLDPILDMDSGHPMGFLLYGNVTPDDVEAFMLDPECVEAFPDGADFNVTECYVRKVPALDESGYPTTRYVYTDAPGPGAKKCTRVEEHTSWGHWCMNHIYEPATTGVPVSQVLDPVWPMVLVRITPPERRRPHARGPQDGPGYVYLCRECSTDFHARLDAARAQAVAELEARSA